MPRLTPEQLTGRTRTHVHEVTAAACTLHAEAARAFLALREAAADDGLQIVAASSFRDFERQLMIWNDKFSGRRPLLDPQGRALDARQMPEEQLVRAIWHWSALPGASRHHWGSEVDLIAAQTPERASRVQLIPAEFAPGGVFAELDRWLVRHAEGFGFFRPYEQDRGGVQPEPWHWSFAPVSVPALQALTLEVLAEALQGADLAGAALVHARLAEYHARYVCAVAAPAPRALEAPALHGRRRGPSREA